MLLKYICFLFFSLFQRPSHLVPGLLILCFSSMSLITMLVNEKSILLAEPASKYSKVWAIFKKHMNSFLFYIILISLNIYKSRLNIPSDTSNSMTTLIIVNRLILYFKGF